jgi:LPXTG-site transpeptidase (sortase) family protein
MKRQALAAAAIVLALAGCVPLAAEGSAIDPTPTASLPPPQVLVEVLPTTTKPPAETSTQEPTPEPFSEAPQDLARELYAERLIEWIKVDAILVYAPVTPVGWSSGGSANNPEAVEWDSPGAKVGWVIDSALPGDESGNIILYGHNNINASVFRSLAELQAGDEISLTTGQTEWLYEVSAVHILPVSGDNAVGERADYAQHLLPGLAPRLTLISCWPPDNNTHRVIVVAYPKIITVSPGS